MVASTIEKKMTMSKQLSTLAQGEVSCCFGLAACSAGRACE
jgi:hypothetical protein